MTKQQQFQLVEWMLALLVTALSFFVWFSVRGDGNLSIYDVFPPLGLIAFGLMWTHYIGGALRRMWGIKKQSNDVYWSVSTGAVLVLIIAHPLLLNYGLIQDGLGLPPASYSAAYPGKEAILLLGTLSLFAFLAFELRRWYGTRNWWHIVDKIQLVAMAAIFTHALILGRELTVGWFQVVWWLYGISLVAAVTYSYWYDKQTNAKEA
ncbi:MAG TPA: hypothetical protein PL051_03865 [Candidatus Saccharibacteria bacterium]|nr:hypothetical protein [Candidatus Saccharibacteria bacterium]